MGLQEKIKEFLKTYGKPDHPDMDDSIHMLLMDDHFYYITDDLSGYYIKKDIAGLTDVDELVHEFLYNGKE